MTAGLILKQTCPVCNKTAVQKDIIDFGNEKLITLLCGHMITQESIVTSQPSTYESIKSSDGKSLMPFQIEGVQFAEKSNIRCLIADEQGLGKTVQALSLLHLHKSKLLPAVLVTKSAIKVQHCFEARRWLGNDLKVQVIFSSKEIAFPGMDLYVTSYDMLKHESVWESLEPRCLIADECQKIKNHSSGRAEAIQKFVKSKDIEHIIGLSGTPIMNNAGEYFTILNILQPMMFPEFNRFLREHCNSYSNLYGNRVGGLSNPDRFRELTKDFIIRRTQKDVLKDLFALRQERKFYHVDLDPKFNQTYKKLLDEIEEMYYSGNYDPTNAIAVITRMRQITGVSKTEECSEFIEEFLDGTDRKIAVFGHHHLAVDLLEQKVNKLLEERGLNKAVMLRAGDDSRQRLQSLSNGRSRVIICSGIAAGEGMDGLQDICNDMILLERQWNPAIEEQIEARLLRYGQTKPVNITYMIAAGTVDDLFTELVEQKRAIVAAAMNNESINWETSSLMQELTERLATTGKKRWTY